MRTLLYSIALSGFIFSCSSTEDSRSPLNHGIDSASLMQHIGVLSSDEFTGRAPSTAGELKTIEYLTTEFERAGAVPGNGDSWLQEVPMVATRLEHTTSMTIATEGEELTWDYREDMMAVSPTMDDSVVLEASEMVFVGYGISAPERGWDDYAGVDVKGKTVVILVNDPGYATQADSVFNGNAMTYYGRWTYKYEEAGRQGAAAALIVHQTGPAGYPWEVVSGGWSGTQFALSGNGSGNKCAVEGWITEASARELFENNELDFAVETERAASGKFRPMPLESTMSLSMSKSFENSVSNNVVALIPGNARPDEYILYSAHWDHLGMDTTLNGDQIYNGAVDNATGTAGLIELAEAFAANPPERSIVLLAVTAEEQGLLGSKYYAENPVYPLAQTVSVINMDALGTYGPTTDFIVIGYGNSELDDYAEKWGGEQGRTVIEDPSPEKGYFFRSDHFSFAKQGVPALYLNEGETHETKGKEFIQQQKELYTAERYHKPGDEINPDWDIRGAIQDLELMYLIGYDLANSEAWPEWREGVAFKAVRDEMRK